MSDTVPQIPPVEKPADTASSDTSVLLEADILDKQAKSAGWRDAYERKQHLDSLFTRITVLQTKLDEREADIRKHLPRLSELEHACRVSKVLVRDGTIILAAGGGLIGIGGLFVQNEVRFALSGIGVGLLVCALWIMKVCNRNAWPADKAEMSNQG